MSRDRSPAVGFNLELVSNVNFSGESVIFSKYDIGEIAKLYRKKKTLYLDKQNINSKWFVELHIKHQTITLLEKKHRRIAS